MKIDNTEKFEVDVLIDMDPNKFEFINIIPDCASFQREAITYSKTLMDSFFTKLNNHNMYK